MNRTVFGGNGSQMTRDQTIRKFLDTAGWGDAVRAPLAGDASFRRYERLQKPAARAVLMDAPPDTGEDCLPFVAISHLLHDRGFSAPVLIAQNLTEGLLLLEDLGDDLFARVIQAGAPAQPLYEAAVDLLADLHNTAIDQGLVDPVTGYRVPPYDLDVLMREVEVCAEWYLPAILPDFNPENRKEFCALWRDILVHGLTDDPVLVLRDYHAENLIWLPDRRDDARVGLLDYQDALMGHPAYDLVSLLQDARRDVDDVLAGAMMARYLESVDTGDGEAFDRAYDVLGAQRNTKILGIFARLDRRDGKPAYLDMIPRVWRYLERDLSHPVLRPVRDWFDANVPADIRSLPPRPVKT